jgi:prepilin-type N-terminal cleavage/methylation domain-containing protein
MQRAVRMSGLKYPQARLRYSYFRRNAGYDLRGISGGFTLVELLIVIAIITIAALTAIPMMSSAASVQIRSAANMLTADLEYAKSMSISRGQKFSVVFDKDTESYRIEDQDNNVIQHPVKKGFNYIVDFKNDGRLNKVDIVDADFDGTSEVKFDYLGSPYNGINSPLNSGVVSLQAGGATTTVTVEAVTGFISVQ